MLRTNSKKAIENIKSYIMQDADYIAERYNGAISEDSTEAVMLGMWECFKDEKKWEIERNYHCASYAIFKDWASGLALGGLFCYYYNRSAVDDLGEILEETEAEKAKYTEAEAEEMLTRLIYRELRANWEKHCIR